MSNFKLDGIDGLIIKDLVKNEDDRGWLIELFRKDMIENDSYPQMSYISLTYPGIARGPHEHLDQTDYFCFVGPSTFKLVLWDNRKESATYKNKMVLNIGENDLKMVIVPPGIVHAYKNIGDKPGLVINLPNRLYAGWGKKEKVDEIRYENSLNSPFKVD
ncbi:dTDP-4-dehydrorhamnose 3,5-epimerase-like enzyme [Candidatus Methanoperedens nitroreducens]|uniref:dTDP-4-dehydrorhamnose 3,5-epimerase-like enzyme n=1 Tax=Candidatus Methanoperedens nitratireducens TaxID=1392998 RepID=A0A062V3Y9_9EURY|nr:dTDP-4-dehydrorhamnose 3,5-epimerase family protein [Candidatus Methanoperedens nitroreducens]KCZ70514.1 dTDP-4-dehydrorhamnose 3,5-epimerase-like enzyme [Candidatus Methanoperedens nitroreducens]MDJ1420366.1 dTDP-4-dehydrorhamnose 3,5-epimerase family protein [Candidatus Methanoperedens sp.]